MALAERLVERLKERGETIAAAESCTAGLAADCIARVPGASLVFWGSFVCYTADAKRRMLAVPDELIQKHGLVSHQVALSMAEGALEKSGSDLAFSLTGLAGPGGDGSETPVGTVWMGFAERRTGSFRPEAKEFFFTGSRNEIREKAVAAVLEELLDRLGPG